MNRFNDKPIVGLDIDGTMGDYHGHFTRFAEQWTGRAMPPTNYNTDGVPLYKWLGMGKSTYRECKLAYRQGGMKRSMPCYPNARELTQAIRKSGAEVWITTTRPYLRLDNIDPDTRHWLRRNGIQHDGIIYGEHKYRDLKRYFGERVLFVVDDLPEMIEVARSIGLDAVLRDQPYNRTWAAANPGVPVVHSMEDIAEYYIDKRGF
jgi:phosphoglycolate phosphatase-like HAD superfamily hydrolase